MNAVTQRLNESFGRRARDWALRRQGVDPLSSCLESRRIYILPTRAGLIYAAVIFTMLVGSMNYNNNMGFALTFLLASIGIIGIYHCHRNLADLCIHFSGSQPAFAGEAVCFEFVLDNQSPYFRAQLRFGHNGRQNTCTSLAENQRERSSIHVESSRRGRLHLPRLLLSTRYPLGLFRAWTWIHMDIEEVVYPQPVPNARVKASCHGGRSTTGRNSPGEDDFSGLRTYRIGDAPRRIAWKILARTGETLITEYHGGSRETVWIDWLDYPNSDDETRLSLLTRRILDTEAAGLPWGLRLPGHVIGPGRGSAHQHQCLRALALYEAGDESV